jgi:hypothetical protein
VDRIQSARTAHLKDAPNPARYQLWAGQLNIKVIVQHDGHIAAATQITWIVIRVT